MLEFQCEIFVFWISLFLEIDYQHECFYLLCNKTSRRMCFEDLSWILLDHLKRKPDPPPQNRRSTFGWDAAFPEAQLAIREVLTEKAAKGMESNLRPSIGHAFTSSIFGNFAYSEMKKCRKERENSDTHHKTWQRKHEAIRKESPRVVVQSMKMIWRNKNNPQMVYWSTRNWPLDDNTEVTLRGRMKESPSGGKNPHISLPRLLKLNSPLHD